MCDLFGAAINRVDPETGRKASGAGVRIILILISLLAPGCSVGRGYTRPVLQTPAHWRAPSDSTTRSSLADLEWWEVYQDTVLRQLISTALVQNEDLRLAVA